MMEIKTCEEYILNELSETKQGLHNAVHALYEQEEKLNSIITEQNTRIEELSKSYIELVNLIRNVASKSKSMDSDYIHFDLVFKEYSEEYYNILCDIIGDIADTPDNAGDTDGKSE